MKNFKVGELVKMYREELVFITKELGDTDNGYTETFKQNTIVEIIAINEPEEWVDVWFPVQRVFAEGCENYWFKKVNE